MLLWLDNTGLQTAGRALAGRAEKRDDKDDDDARSLLQLATFVVFADQLMINGFESDAVADSTQRLRDQLLGLGLPGDALTIVSHDQDSYGSACKVAAARAAAEMMDFGFEPCPSTPGILHPAALIPELKARKSVLPIAIKFEQGSSALEDIRHTALCEKAVGAVNYMAATCPKLHEALRLWARKDTNRTPLACKQLDGFLRKCLNDSLAAQKHARYAPAITRAKVIRHNTKLLFQRLLEETDKAVRDVIGKDLPVPSVFGVLVARAHADPKGVIAEAVSLREKTSSLRKELGRLAADIDVDVQDHITEREKTVRQLATVLRAEMGLEQRPVWSEAVTLSVPLGISIDPRRARRFAEFHRAAQKLSALTDLSREAVNISDAGVPYQRFLDRCRSAS